MAAEQEEEENAQNAGEVFSEETKKRLIEAKSKRLEAMRAVLAAENKQLINVDNAKCSKEETDGKRIRDAIRNDKEAITRLIAEMIRDRIKLDSPELM